MTEWELLTEMWRPNATSSVWACRKALRHEGPLAVITLLVLAACTPPTLGLDAFTRDSAGVSIVMSLKPRTPGRLTIDLRESVDIGGQSDTAELEFIGPIVAVRLPGGEILAAGWANTELRLFSGRGEWLRSIGGRGSGPGEFEGLGYVYLKEDGGFVTYEPASRRVQTFSSAGRFRDFHVLSASPDEGSPNVVGALSGDDLLIATSYAVDTAATAMLVPNRLRYYRFVLSTGRFIRLLEVPGATYIRHPFRPQLRIAILPFAQPTLVVPGPRGGLLTSTPTGLGVNVHDSTGRIRMSMRLEVPDRPLENTDRRRAAAELTRNMAPAMRAAVKRLVVSARVPRSRPASTALLRAPDGKVFVQHFGTPTIPSVTVSIFGSDGKWEQDLTLPRPMLLSQAGSDFLVGTYVDEDDYYHIVVLRLTATTSGVSLKQR